MAEAEKCRACKNSIEENRTHAGLCDRCIYEKRQPRVRKIYKHIISEFY